MSLFLLIPDKVSELSGVVIREHDLEKDIVLYVAEKKNLNGSIKCVGNEPFFTSFKWKNSIIKIR